jgi:hypothetical protein
MKFFLSHGQDDRRYAASLAAEIERRGGTVWRDDAALSPGSSWEDGLRKAIECADAMILVLPQTGASGANFAVFEAGAAKALGKKVFIVAPNADGRDLPVNIADLAIFDADNKPLDEVVGALIRYAS